VFWYCFKHFHCLHNYKGFKEIELPSCHCILCFPQSDRWFYIDDGPMFETLEQVIDHYSMFADGLPTVLTKPVPPPDGQLLNRKPRGVRMACIPVLLCLLVVLCSVSIHWIVMHCSSLVCSPLPPPYLLPSRQEDLPQHLQGRIAA